MPAVHKIEILVADDQDIVRLGIQGLVAGTEIKVAAEAKNGKAAMKLAFEKHFDLILLGLRLPDGDGLTVLSRIKLDKPNLPVLLFSAFDNRAAIAKAVALGASGYLSKGCSTGEFLAAIRAVAAGENFWKSVKSRKAGHSLDSTSLTGTLEASLTKREGEVIQQVALGLSNEKIGGKLTISTETVKEHVQNILRKLGLRDRTQAAVWALQNGAA